MLYKLLLATTVSSPHLQGTLLPRGFFLGLGAIYLLALAADRLAANFRLPGAAAILLLGLVIPTDWLTQSQWLDSVHVETVHRVSLALLIFYAGLKTNVRRIRGLSSVGLALGIGGVVLTVGITGLVLVLLAPLVWPGLPPSRRFAGGGLPRSNRQWRDRRFADRGRSSHQRTFEPSFAIRGCG